MSELGKFEGNTKGLINRMIRQDNQSMSPDSFQNPSPDSSSGNPQLQSDSGGTMGLGIASLLPENAVNLLNRNDLHAKITNSTITYYPAARSKEFGSRRDDKVEENLKKESYAGILTEPVKRKILNKLDTWLSLVSCYNQNKVKKFQRKQTYITFLTVTLAEKQIKSDKEIQKQVLSQYIDKLKYHFGIENYLWRAERQDNGNIHYHILLDRYADKQKLQNLWNKTLKKTGLLTEFARKNKHYNPPSTHVKALPSDQAAKKYFTKYAMKTEKQQQIHGRVWYASKSIINLKPLTLHGLSTIRTFINYLLNNHKVRIYESDYATTIINLESSSAQGRQHYVYRILQEYYLLLYHILYRERHATDQNYNYKQKFQIENTNLNSVKNLLN